MALSRYKISFLVRKPGGAHTFGAHKGGVVISDNYVNAFELLKKDVEAEGWEVERGLAVKKTPLLKGKDGTD